MPQHLMDGCEKINAKQPQLKTRIRRRGSSLVVIPCLIFISSTSTNAYSTITQNPLSFSPSSKSLVDQARMIRELKNNSNSDRPANTNTDESKPTFDNHALSAALFDDDYTNSLDVAIANIKRVNSSSNEYKPTDNSAKSAAEEFDRFMEEDATVASIVHENTKPGSLVDEVQQSRGSDIVDMEVLLQREAADRRMRREQLKSKLAARVEVVDRKSLSSTPAIKVTRTTKLSSSTPSKQTSPATKQALLSKDQEYKLAYTIQEGTHLHKLKAEYESKHTKPLTKKSWAQLANMSPNELRKLISEYRSAKQELVSHNMGLVHAVVRNYSGKANLRGVPLDELVQEGSLGLIRAAELFDPAKGLRFSTYATIWIKGVLSNSNLLDEVIQLPSREKVLRNKVRVAWEDMKLEDDRNSGKQPSASSAKEIAQRLNMKETVVKTHIQRMACASNVLSLDYQYTTSTRSGSMNDKQESLRNSLSMGTDADLAEELQLKADVLSELVRNLSEKEVTLMRLRYGLGEDGQEHTVKECASIMGINRETARLLQHTCLKKLREASSMESLQEYLLTVA